MRMWKFGRVTPRSRTVAEAEFIRAFFCYIPYYASSYCFMYYLFFNNPFCNPFYTVAYYYFVPKIHSIHHFMHHLVLFHRVTCRDSFCLAIIRPVTACDIRPLAANCLSETISLLMLPRHRQWLLHFSLSLSQKGTTCWRFLPGHERQAWALGAGSG